MGLFDISVTNNQGQEVNMASYQGKVLLIVNTATGCGFTPQYKGLQQLFDTFQSRGFEVLDFPCNQFGNQAPGNETEIESFCTLRYQTTFPRFAKTDVNGPHENPVFTHLKASKKGFLNDGIKWNFTKFLVDKAGNVVERYGPTTKPEDIEKDIIALLG